MKNTIKNPLILKWSSISTEYKVNKPNIEDGEFVDKQVAEDLLQACIWAKKQFEILADAGTYPSHMMLKNGGNGFMPLLNAIKNATE